MASVLARHHDSLPLRCTTSTAIGCDQFVAGEVDEVPVVVAAAGVVFERADRRRPPGRPAGADELLEGVHHPGCSDVGR